MPFLKHTSPWPNKGMSLLDTNGSPNDLYQGLAEPLEKMADKLSIAWGTVSHLKVPPNPPQTGHVHFLHTLHRCPWLALVPGSWPMPSPLQN